MCMSATLTGQKWAADPKRVADSCETPHGRWESSLGPLHKHQVFFLAEPQPCLLFSPHWPPTKSLPMWQRRTMNLALLI